MKKFKINCLVVRKSHNKDILFKIKKIIKTNNNIFAILQGVFERIVVDSPISDLEIVEKQTFKKILNTFNENIEKKINSSISYNRLLKTKKIPGKILHLDGDKKYAIKSYHYYKKLGLNAIVKNIDEYKQPKLVYSLLKYYSPNILIITGHDGMIKRNVKYHDLYNYRNSRHFINSVLEARKYDNENNKNTVIFAGACQSYYEALISAGANFASSPSRILIDFLDPIIIAEKIATTENNKYITTDDLLPYLKNGKKSVDGIGAFGQLKSVVTHL